ncbi:MAG: D-alanyl-D-alanine carboxypeptidase [Haloplasmataceae bacterium]|jgi:D-alanyl-D-alanine carboxypeptidase|nr:D-alanyl-D-alanine carboxypeptidase [Haloplasmataceae bacterium]
MLKKLLFSSTLIFAFIILFINHGEEIKLINLTLTNSTTVDDFTKLGYNNDDLAVLSTKLSEEQTSLIITKQIPKNALFPYLNYKNFKFESFEHYETIRLSKQMSYLETINTVNHPNLMINFYSNVQNAINVDNNLMLVNKNYYLKDDYVPKDLVFPEKLNLLIPQETTRNFVKQETYDALFELFEAAKKKGIYLYLSNGYRSYEKQDRIYNQYIIEGSDADRYSARAGHSEHQTGYAVDLTAKSVEFLLIEEFAQTNEGKFLQGNAYKYGFIIRYPKDKEHLTGYNYEPWHIRYVGSQVAEIITKQNLTLEEYLIKYTEIK